MLPPPPLARLPLRDLRAAVLGARAGSASYIAAPAAARAGLPDANPANLLPLAPGVVFPFNLPIGIPPNYGLAKLTAR